jgi:polysaccharide biosynthesis protein
MLNSVKTLYSRQSDDLKGLVKGVFWSLFGSVLSKALVFLSWILVARILGRESYGEYGLIRNTVLMFSAFAGFGLSVTATRFVARYINEDVAKSGRIASLTLSFSVIMGLSISLIVFAFSDVIAQSVIKDARLATDFRIASFILFFSALEGAQTGVLQGMRQFRRIAVINLVNAFVSFPVFVAGAYYFGTTGSVVALGITTMVLCIQNQAAIYSFAKKGLISLNFRQGWREWRLLYIFSLPAALAGIISIPLKWYTDVMLVNTSGFSAMGIYSAAFLIYTIVAVLANTMNAPFVSFMSGSKADNDVIEKLNILVPWFLGIMIGLPFLCFPEAGGYLFGKEYQGEEFNNTLVFIILYMIIVMYKQGMNRIFIVHNMQWINLMTVTVWGLILIGSFYMLKEYASVGLAISYCISYTLVTILIYPLYVKRKLMPLEFIISRNVLTIWGTMALAAYLSLSRVHWGYRIAAYVGIMAVVVFTFKNMLKSKVKYNLFSHE